MSDLYAGVPTSPKNIIVRPLTGGIVRNAPSALIPDGAQTDLVEANVYAEGLERRAGRAVYRKGPINPVPFLFPTETIVDTLLFTTPTGSRQLLVLTDRVLYLETAGTFLPVPWVTNYVQSNITGAVLTDETVGRDFAAEGVIAGMKVVLTTTTGDREVFEVATGGVGTSTLTLTESPTGTYESAITLVWVFEPGEEFVPDWTLTQVRAYFCDGTPKGVVRYDGSFLQPHPLQDSEGTTTLLGCRTIDWFSDYLWFGYCLEANGDVIRNRIRWSTALNDERVEADAYQDLAEFGGEILKLKPLGIYNIVYLSDGVAFGRQSNLTGLPYVYAKIETGNAGLVGMRAVAGALNAHFFVSASDVMVIGTDLNVASIGAAVAPVSFKIASNKLKTIARPDPQRKRILFALALSGSTLDTLYAFYLDSKAWARFNVAVTAIGSVGGFTTDTLGDYPTTTIGSLGTRTYYSFKGSLSDQQIYFADANGFLFSLSESAATDDILSLVGTDWSITQAPIFFLLETKDFDFGLPDQIKTITRLGLRISEPYTTRTQVLEFSVEGSTNRGVTWKPLGTMRLRVGDDESAVNFLLTGSLMRFRITSSSLVAPYRIEEMGLRVRSRGLEVQRGDLHG